MLARSTTTGDDPVAWTSDEQQAVSQTPLPAQPRLTGSLENVASVTVDAQRACLAGKAVTYDITTDGQVTIRFSDRRTLSLGGGHSQGTLAP